MRLEVGVDVEPLAGRDARVLGRRVVDEEQPAHVPDHADAASDVEDGLPAAGPVPARQRARRQDRHRRAQLLTWGGMDGGCLIGCPGLSFQCLVVLGNWGVQNSSEQTCSSTTGVLSLNGNSDRA